MNAYDCHETFRRIHDYVDRELTPEEIEAVEAHLEWCARCAREFRFEAQVLDDLRNHLQRVTAPSELKSRILGSLPGPTDGGDDGDPGAGAPAPDEPTG